MANPFDEFDDSGNPIDSSDPFAQFDANGEVPKDPFIEFDESGESVEGQDTLGVINDVWSSYAAGANNLLKIGGDIYGLATGDMENFASQQGASGAEYWNNKKTDALKDLEESRKNKISQADTEYGKAGVAFWETISSPQLMTSFMFEQAPMLLTTGGVGRVAGSAAKAAGATQKVAAGAAVTGAVGTGAVMGGADAGSQAYDKLLQIDNKIWAANPELRKLMADKDLGFETAKQMLAADMSKDPAIATAIVSGVTSFIPGARYLEKAVSGVKLPGKSRISSAIIGFLGEGTQEAIEEGFSALSSNITAMQVDNDVDPFEGVGESAGMGFAAGPFGGIAGGLKATPLSPEEELAEEMSLVADNTGFITPAADVAAEALDPLKGQRETVDNIFQAETVDDAINVATLSVDTTLADSGIPSPLQVTQPEPDVSPISLGTQDDLPLAADFGLDVEAFDRLQKDKAFTAAEAQRDQQLEDQKQADIEQAPVDMATAEAEAKDLLAETKETPPSPAMEEAMRQAQLDVMQPVDVVDPIDAMEPLDATDLEQDVALQEMQPVDLPGEEEQAVIDEQVRQAELDAIEPVDTGLEEDIALDDMQPVDLPAEGEVVELKDIRIQEDVMTDGGDRVMISRTADVAIRDVDSRIDGMKLLSGCINGSAS